MKFLALSQALTTASLATALALLSSGCGTHRIDPPTGFAQVEKDEYGTTMIAPDHVGLKVKAWDNVKGGSLGFWGEDLVNKLGTRGYALQKQSAVKSKNNVAGTRFDFAYTAPDGAEKFYAAVLFTSDDYRVVLQVAGDAKLAPRYLSNLDSIAGQTVVRGCKIRNSLCKSPQPGKLSTPARNAPTKPALPTDAPAPS